MLTGAARGPARSLQCPEVVGQDGVSVCSGAGRKGVLSREFKNNARKLRPVVKSSRPGGQGWANHSLSLDRAAHRP